MRYLVVSKLDTSLGKKVGTTLLEMYIFTWCDSDSAFAGHRKVTGLKLITREENLQRALAELRQH